MNKNVEGVDINKQVGKQVGLVTLCYVIKLGMQVKQLTLGVSRYTTYRYQVR